MTWRKRVYKKVGENESEWKEDWGSDGTKNYRCIMPNCKLAKSGGKYTSFITYYYILFDLKIFRQLNLSSISSFLI